MKKTFFSIVSLALLFLPTFTHLRSSSSFISDADTGTVNAAHLPESGAIGKVQARIAEAKRLLKRQPHDSSTNFVTIAAQDPATSQIHLLTLSKESFLSDGAETVVHSSLDAPLKLRVVRANYVNTAVQISNLKGDGLQPLMVQYPVEKKGTLSEVAYYTSAHPAMKSPDATNAGQRYVHRMLAQARERLQKKGMKISPDIVEAAERLCIVEHTDHKRFDAEERGALFSEIYTLYALNGGDTYRYSVSTAGAGGMIQMIPLTYEMVRRLHPKAGLREDFVDGMRDHGNALEAMLLYMQDTWNDLLRREEIRQALDSQTATQAELLAAGYNSNPARLAVYLERGGANWRTLIPRETQMYLRIYESVENHIPFTPHS
ncbi:MAG TPA: hypothetical protein VF666_13175 [Pyrinomonadaceae bacterium]|jgi:hypothetical protein